MVTLHRPSRICKRRRQPIREAGPTSTLSSQGAENFLGTERFLVQRRLGSGAFGVVYEAYDRESDTVVALKVLRFAEADALYRFKKGFRSLADIRHPNLNAFYELLSEGGEWFVTMELVDGVDFIAHLRSDLPVTMRDGRAFEAVNGYRPQAVEPVSAVPDFDRIRQAVAQLARGLVTLHRNGKLHRDIKPPNVLVTDRGRVVLLDFGLVADLGPLGIDESVLTQLVGTPAYMSPEQAEGLAASPASDWYSVGVMLYEGLTGQLPFRGSLVEMVRRKRQGLNRPLREILPAVPTDLEEICHGLLEPMGALRLGGEEVLRRLGTVKTSVKAEPSPAPSSAGELREPVFIGRGEILDALRQALARSRSGAAAMFIHGASGMGKTALVQRFLNEVDRDREPTVILRGRCYRRESVPYKALDSLVDALSRYLHGLPRPQVEILLPTQVVALARVFPVLRRVPAVAAAPSRSIDAADPKVLRRRAFAALRELLARLGERTSVLLFIDDLQWGDVDSFQLLEELLRPPDPPPLLLIGCYRSEDRRTSPVLRALAEQTKSLRQHNSDVREIEAGKLAPQEAREMIFALLAEWGQPPANGEGYDEEAIQMIIAEAGGSPFFITELVRYSRDQAGALATAAGETTDDSGVIAVMLRDVVLQRVKRLPLDGRRLLEVVAVAGKPVELEVAWQAAGCDSDRDEAVSLLRRERLLRRIASSGHQEIEIFHDRIREAVMFSLPERTLRDRHQALAIALESSGRADPETLAVHFRLTDDVARAGSYAASAAARAAEALAFERAARLYRLAIDLLPPESTERFTLLVKLADSLANAGRSQEAAETYLRSVRDSVYFNPLELQRNAAENLLISGHIDRGLAVLRHVLRAVGMRLESRPWKSLFHLWRCRMILRLRGFRFRERDATACEQRDLRRIDICWSVEIGLCLVDILHASEFHARHLLLALNAGEPQRIARGMAMEVFFGTIDGTDPSAASHLARELAGRVEGAYASSLTEMASGMVACSRGRWVDARRQLESAERHLGESGGGVAWELDTVAHFRVLALLHLGRWQELFDDLPGLLTSAQKRGDRYLEIHLRHWVSCLQHLAADNPSAAAAEVGEAIGRWSYQGFHYQHFGHLVAEAQIALYRGDGKAAWDLVTGRWLRLSGSMIQRIPMVLIQSHDLRARCALSAAAANHGGQRPWLSRARRDARRLARTQAIWATALADLILAGMHSIDGETDAAIVALEQAETTFTGSAMAVHAAVARRCRGALMADEDGAALVAAADGELQAQGIRAPRAIAAMLAPGRWS